MNTRVWYALTRDLRAQMTYGFFTTMAAAMRQRDQQNYRGGYPAHVVRVTVSSDSQRQEVVI